MKKLRLILAAFLTFGTLFSGSLSAQWVNDPESNTIIANTSNDAGEIYLSTNAATGDTYFQWADMIAGGWRPSLQRVDIHGVPQWGTDGICITSHNFDSYSQGMAMVATNDNAVVSCFMDNTSRVWAVKINADGTFAWGEQGIDLEINNAGRTELAAGTDGGVWALTAGDGYQTTKLRYINADGSLNPIITISDANNSCIYAKLIAGTDDNVFVTYEKIGSGMWYVEKEIWVAGYYRDGSLVSPAERLMGPQTFGVSYIHNNISDGLGGGYVYISHSGINEMFNVYVFHFDANGLSTISNPNGISVHSPDDSNYYGTPYATVDPVTHDIMLIYSQTDAYAQSEDRLYVNRITTTGERIWGEGLLIADNDGLQHSSSKIDAFPNGQGFMVSYLSGDYQSAMYETFGHDMDGNRQWGTRISTAYHKKTGAENSTGFHNRQNILAWNSENTGKLYAQNIDTEGNMGIIEPEPCAPPTLLEGQYVWNDDDHSFGTAISWTAPEETPLHYNLYRDDFLTKETTVIEVAGSETSYFDAVETGSYKYQLTAVYADCESDFGLTADGDDHLIIEVTGVEEHEAEAIVKTIKVYNLAGQVVRCDHLETLSPGIYIIQGLTASGAKVSQKLVIREKQ